MNKKINSNDDNSGIYILGYDAYDDGRMVKAAINDGIDTNFNDPFQVELEDDDDDLNDTLMISDIDDNDNDNDNDDDDDDDDDYDDDDDDDLSFNDINATNDDILFSNNMNDMNYMNNMNGKNIMNKSNMNKLKRNRNENNNDIYNIYNINDICNSSNNPLKKQKISPSSTLNINNICKSNDSYNINYNYNYDNNSNSEIIQRLKLLENKCVEIEKRIKKNVITLNVQTIHNVDRFLIIFYSDWFKQNGATICLSWTKSKIKRQIINLFTFRDKLFFITNPQKWTFNANKHSESLWNVTFLKSKYKIIKLEYFDNEKMLDWIQIYNKLKNELLSLQNNKNIKYKYFLIYQRFGQCQQRISRNITDLSQYKETEEIKLNFGLKFFIKYQDMIQQKQSQRNSNKTTNKNLSGISREELKSLPLF